MRGKQNHFLFRFWFKSSLTVRRTALETRLWLTDFWTSSTLQRMALLCLQTGLPRSFSQDFYDEHYSQTDIIKLNLLGNFILYLPEQ